MSPWHLLTCPWHHYRSQREVGICRQGFWVWCADHREAMDLQTRKWSYSFTVEMPGRREPGPLPENQRWWRSEAPGSSVAGASSEGEVVSPHLWKVRTEEGAGWVLPISVLRRGRLQLANLIPALTAFSFRGFNFWHGPYWPLWHLRDICKESLLISF